MGFRHAAKCTLNADVGIYFRTFFLIKSIVWDCDFLCVFIKSKEAWVRPETFDRRNVVDAVNEKCLRQAFFVVWWIF